VRGAHGHERRVELPDALAPARGFAVPTPRQSRVLSMSFANGQRLTPEGQTTVSLNPMDVMYRFG
jgi:hypothetical protein